MNEELRQRVRGLVDPFLKDWCGDNYAHLVDSDENAGERLRDDIIDLIHEREVEAVKGFVEEIKKTNEYQTYIPTMHSSVTGEKWHGLNQNIDHILAKYTSDIKEEE